MTERELDELLSRFGFDRATFETLRARVAGGRGNPSDNVVRGRVTAPRLEDVTPWFGEAGPTSTGARARFEARGRDAIRRGEVGAVVLAGGMATRFGGVVKATVDALPGRTFLELKLTDIARVAERCGGRVPTYLMTSFATHDEVTRAAHVFDAEAHPVVTFPQFISLRLTESGELFRDTSGLPSPYAPGHGDLPFALRRAGLLQRFCDGGGRLLYMSNVDNLTATLDPAIVGFHLEHGAPITVEVAPKWPGDRGGAPARVDDRLQIVESFRFPADFDQDLIPVFNTNTFVFDASALDRDFELTWFGVRKTVDGAPTLQFERLVGELTAFLETRCLEVPRTGSDARFQPAKDPEELATRRPEIELALGARGVL